MEHAAWQIVGILLQQGDHLVLRLAAMDHQRQTGLDAPAYLLFKGFYLFFFKLAAPIIVEAHLADGNKAKPPSGLTEGSWPPPDLPEGRSLISSERVGKKLFHLGKHIAIVGLHLFGMQANHRIGIAGILPAGVCHRLNRGEVDGGDEHFAHPCILGPLHHFGAVVVILRSVQVCVCIYHFDV